MNNLAILILFSFLITTILSANTPCDAAPAWNPTPPIQSGTSSWFNATLQAGSNPTTGACAWVVSKTDLYVAAYTASTSTAECTFCGDCYSVTGPKGTAVVRIIDYCDTSAGQCGLNVEPQWTLNVEPFIVIAGSTGVGSCKATWNGPVACPVTGSLVYTGLSGTNVWYVSIRVANHRYPLKTVEFSNPGLGGNFTNINRYGGNQWYYNPTTQQQWPFTIRVTDVVGNVVTDTITLDMMSTTTTGTGGNGAGSGTSGSPTSRSNPSSSSGSPTSRSNPSSSSASPSGSGPSGSNPSGSNPSGSTEKESTKSSSGDHVKILCFFILAVLICL